jgi:beta-lactamase regulating signal transducer with metallopeptidase domain
MPGNVPTVLEDRRTNAAARFVMTTLLNVLLLNAVVVVPLALVVWGVSRLAKRPALSHVLWVLVLFKLITPPFFHLPFSIAIPVARQAVRDRDWTADVPLVTADGAQASDATEPGASRGSAASDNGQVATGQVATGQVATALAPSASESSRQPARTSRTASWFGSRWRSAQALVVSAVTRPAFLGIALILWLSGSVLWFAHQANRAWRFWQTIESSTLPDENLQLQAMQLARRFGLRRCPQVLVVDAQLSPMLWGYGTRLRLLFPASLARRLDADSRATLIAHELAHFSRGDHWIRVLELIVTGAFWWHPVVWFARLMIEESEEECCDAWVVTELPHAPRRYAEALLDTIDFLCDTPAPVPPLASGLGPAPFLRRRLTRIMQGVSPRDLSARQRCAVLLIAMMALPLQPFVLGSNSTALQTVETSLKAPNPLPVPETIPDSDPAESVIQLDGSPQPEPPSPVRSTAAAKRGRRSMRGERILGTAVSSNGHYAVDMTSGRRVLLSNLAQNTQMELSGHITSVAFLPDGDSFVAGGSDGSVTLWSAVTGTIVRSLYTHGNVVRSVAVSPKGNVVAIGGTDGTVALIDMTDGQILTESRGDLPVNCVRFSPDSRRLAVAVGDWSSTDPGQVAIWDLESGQVAEPLTSKTTPGAVNFASNVELIVGEYNGHISLWNLVKGKVIARATADKSIVDASSFSPDNPVLGQVPFVPTLEFESP